MLNSRDNPRNGDESMDVAATFSARLRALRRARGWSLTETAQRVGFAHRETVCRYEKGATVPLLTMAIRFANAFDVSLDSLCREPSAALAPGNSSTAAAAGAWRSQTG